MWSVLEDVPCALKKVYSSTFGWNVLKLSMRPISSNVSLKTSVSLIIFGFDDLSVGVSGVLKSSTITGLLLISPFMSVSVCLGEGNGTPLQYSCLENPMDRGAWWAAVHGVTESRTQLRDFTFIFHFCTLEKEMATHSSVLAWRIPGMGEPGGLPSTGSHRVGHN